MNQAIQFPDREEWDENKKCVCFPALVNGMQLTCAISGESLAYRFTGDTPELKWFTEFGHLNRGDMLTSEQHRCHNEKKKFQRRV